MDTIFLRGFNVLGVYLIRTLELLKCVFLIPQSEVVHAELINRVAIFLVCTNGQIIEFALNVLKQLSLGCHFGVKWGFWWFLVVLL
jgi:hypothetical protein